jgi:Ferredoxin thioredoxin reductase variable alpha chain.
MAVIQEAHVMQVGETFPVGSRVRVAQSVIVYHHPEHRNQPFDMKGQEGEVIEIVREWQGKPISANLPYLVKFGNKFRAHFQASELELVSSP